MMKTTQTLGKVPVLTMADYILKHYGPMSHLKLQKLLYYVQAYHLAYFNVQLMDAEFQAWMHGPVCRVVFDAQKEVSRLYNDIGFDASKDVNPDPVILPRLSSYQLELVIDVLKTLSIWSGLELETAVHQEKPWLLARVGYDRAARCEEVITEESMRTYYLKDLNVC